MNFDYQSEDQNPASADPVEIDYQVFSTDQGLSMEAVAEQGIKFLGSAVEVAGSAIPGLGNRAPPSAPLPLLIPYPCMYSPCYVAEQGFLDLLSDNWPTQPTRPGTTRRWQR